MTEQIKRGEIYYMVFDNAIGSEQDNIRPALVVSNDIGNANSPTIIVVPLTSSKKSKNLPIHVQISKSCGLSNDSVALTEQIRTFDRMRLGSYIGRISEDEQAAVDIALATSVGL